MCHLACERKKGEKDGRKRVRERTNPKGSSFFFQRKEFPLSIDPAKDRTESERCGMKEKKNVSAPPIGQLTAVATSGLGVKQSA